MQVRSGQLPFLGVINGPSFPPVDVEGTAFGGRCVSTDARYGPAEAGNVHKFGARSGLVGHWGGKADEGPDPKALFGAGQGNSGRGSRSATWFPAPVLRYL